MGMVITFQRDIFRVLLVLVIFSVTVNLRGLLVTDLTDCWPGFNTGLVSAWRASVAPLCLSDDCQAVTGYKRVL